MSLHCLGNFAFAKYNAKSACVIRKAVFFIENSKIGARLYQVNSCSGKINELLYKDSLAIDLISEIYQNKKILIPQRINDIIITYFRNIIKKLRKFKINQKYILLSDYMRLATNAASFINNLEKSTKIKVIDKTSNQTIDMIILSILNNLQQTKEGRFIHQNHLSLFHHNKRLSLHMPSSQHTD